MIKPNEIRTKNEIEAWCKAVELESDDELRKYVYLAFLAELETDDLIRSLFIPYQSGSAPESLA